MEEKVYASYLRVSTQKQGRSQLGLSSQRDICNGFIRHNGGVLGQEFVDVESGTHRDRKGLWDAINYCKEHDCPLVIATLSRLARDVEFCFKVVNTGVEIHFVDMPQVSTLMLGIFATVAQYERELTSERTRNALKELKKKGVKLGASNEKYRINYNNKDYQMKLQSHRKKGITKNLRYLESKNTQAMFKVLRRVFPDACKGEPCDWDWSKINTREENREKIFYTMRSFQEIDETLFPKWVLEGDDVMGKKQQVKLASTFTSLRESLLRAQTINNSINN